MRIDPHSLRDLAVAGVLAVGSSLVALGGRAVAQSQADWVSRVPQGTYSDAMVYDAARQRTVLFGLYSPALATVEPFGSPCSSSGNPPILTSRTPYLGNPAFALELIDARASSACVFGLSAGGQARPVPPCILYLQDPIIPLFAVTNWAGFAQSTPFARGLSGRKDLPQSP